MFKTASNFNNISKIYLILILGLVQFIDILDFMIIMPLGPDFALSFNLKQSELGLSAVSYVIASAISGVVSARFIDRFDRKKAIILALFGLIFANFLGSISPSFEFLMCARFLAGFAGCQTTALTFAIITDLVKEEDRGYVIGKVMSAFSFAATIGVPVGLEVSRLYGWRFSILLIASIAVIVTIMISIYLPTLTKHLDDQKTLKKVTYSEIFSNRTYLLGFVFASVAQFSTFLIIPYISAYLQLNLNFERENLSLLYFIGGVCSFFAVQIIGKIVDKKGSVFVIILSYLFMFPGLYFCFLYRVDIRYIYIFYAMMMISISIRNVAMQALSSKIPNNYDRAGFFSMSATFQSISTGIGSFLASVILYQSDVSKPLEGMLYNVLLCMIALLAIPYVAKKIEVRIG